MAMGRMPPSFFSKAIKVAPAKKGDNSAGASPLASKLTKAVSCSRASSACAPEIASLRCCGRNAVGPAAAPRGKALTILWTVSLLMSGTAARGEGPNECKSTGLLARGCFDWS
eukprot:4367912-Karenia_brevis.AAC.1